MKYFIICLAFLGCFFNHLPAQVPDSNVVKDVKLLRFSISQFYTPITLIGAGILTNNNHENAIKYKIVEKRNEYLPDFHTKVDDYLPFTPIAVAYGLDFLGVPSKTDFCNRSVILIKGELFTLGVVNVLKKATHQLRPDGSAYTSFPSGHTAWTFAAATFLSEEYQDRFKWMPYAAYGIATSVGVLRMANNKHYISDVLTGAGIGILSMKIAYWTHQYKWGKSSKKLDP